MDEIKIGKALEEEESRGEGGWEKRGGEEEKGGGDGKKIGILLLVLAGVMLLSIGGFKAYDYFTGAEIIDVDYLHKENLEGDLEPERGYMYRSYSFVFIDGLWWTEVYQGGVKVIPRLHFGPREVEEVKVGGRLSSSFNEGEVVYIAIDPELANKYYTLALSELNFNVVKGIKRQPVAACTKENSICEGREILSCENSQGKPVIELKYGGEEKIELKGNCILVSGEDYGMVKAADRLIWQWYGVMG